MDIVKFIAKDAFIRKSELNFPAQVKFPSLINTNLNQMLPKENCLRWPDIFELDIEGRNSEISKMLD